MAGNSKMPRDRVNTKIDKFIRMEANGCTREQKMRELFGLDVNTATARELNNADSCMSRWRKHPLFDQVWKDELSRQDYSDIIESMSVLRKGMRQDKDGWLAMNSAINLMNTSIKRVFRNEEKTINVQFTGMPDIGSPDNDG